MKTLIAVVLLAVALPALADDKPWPQKGDTVYVAAVLPKVTAGMMFGFKAPDMDALPACAPVVVRKVAKGHTTIQEQSGGQRRLEGDWRGAFYRTSDECGTATVRSASVRWIRGGSYPIHELPTH